MGVRAQWACPRGYRMNDNRADAVAGISIVSTETGMSGGG